uniref:Uncharacterized protein n=1 Tax=Candidatus Kentrum eta TaxID=2126337 RepID=A0A450VBG6_9GAMM|nr:MAG: hypothetical protein BECKH772B_GA0070898_102593 [Candidatus Kentron sp. H]VFK02113.1 MAG: hypothetical protein BECKH772A_GA0070896_102544 [Candidatus Kentron sp. H]VFK05254.1 MAG: hypothetical protein BECKH772C_GA0070978_102524 [Candidatus Kentron sp. H]
MPFHRRGMERGLELGRGKSEIALPTRLLGYTFSGRFPNFPAQQALIAPSHMEAFNTAVICNTTRLSTCLKM